MPIHRIPLGLLCVAPSATKQPHPSKHREIPSPHYYPQARGPSERLRRRAIGKGGPNVRFGSKADMCSAKRHVRFTPKSGHVRCKVGCLLSANSGHSVAEACRSDDNALPSAIKRKPLPTPPRRGGESNFRQIPHDAEAPNMPTGLRTRGGAGLQLFLEVGVRSGSDT